MSEYKNPRNSLVLYGLLDQFSFLINLYKAQKMPKVLMVSGKKGIGKFTLMFHFMF